MSQFANQDTRIGQDMPVKSRRSFFRGMATVAGLTAASGGVSILPAAMQMFGGDRAVREPNVVLYVADQICSNFGGAYGLNPTVMTPNLDLYFVILKDHQGIVCGLGQRSLVLYQSSDAAHWEKAGRWFAADLLQHWKGRPAERVQALELPQPAFDAEAIPSRSWSPSASMSCTVTTCASHSRAISIGSTGPQRRVK